MAGKRSDLKHRGGRWIGTLLLVLAAFLAAGAGAGSAELAAQEPEPDPTDRRPSAEPGDAEEEPRFPDVPFVVTPMPVVEAMLGMAAPTARDSLFDLGSGDGRIPILAAARYGALSVGVELQDTLVRISRRNAARAGVSERTRFIAGDLFDTDLRPASVVTLYLFTTVNLRLRPKLLRELRPGARVVSHHFGMGDWRPDSTVTVPDHHDPVYLWIVPADVSGRWRLRVDGGGASAGTGGEAVAGAETDPRGPLTATVVLEQRFQEVRGGRRGDEVGPDEARLEEARVRGDSVFLSLRRPDGAGGGVLRLRGVADGDRMEGSTRSGRSWSGERIGGAGGSLEEWGRGRSGEGRSREGRAPDARTRDLSRESSG